MDRFTNGCDIQSVCLEESLPIRARAYLEESVVIQNERLRRLAVGISLSSVILNTLLAVVSFVCSAIQGSSTTFAFGLDCLMDVASSAVVVWRYCGSPKTMYQSGREKKACIWLGYCFVFSGFLVILKSAWDYYMTEAVEWHDDLVILAGIGSGLCVGLFIAKYVLYKQIHSQSVFLDAINSIIGGGFAMVIILTNCLVLQDDSLGYMDPVLSIILSLCLMVYGVKVLLNHMKPRHKHPYGPINA